MSSYDQVVTGFSRSLQNLAVVLDKADRHARANKYEMAALLDARLYPDMFPCKRQIQLATDFAKGSAGRLAGVEVPTWEDTDRLLKNCCGHQRRRLTGPVDGQCRRASGIKAAGLALAGAAP
ncbi:MAG: DUF1993 family protein [Gammaproteobacteria bacterium]|nr:DUF1993 family protein [Gammaproteobacteria bacterium]